MMSSVDGGSDDTRPPGWLAVGRELSRHRHHQFSAGQVPRYSAATSPPADAPRHHNGVPRWVPNAAAIPEELSGQPATQSTSTGSSPIGSPPIPTAGSQPTAAGRPHRGH